MSNIMMRTDKSIEDLLILLSRVNLDVKTIESTQSIIADLNWDQFTSLTIKHGVSGFVYKNLLKLKNIPDNILDKFANIYNNTLRSNILIAAETERIVDVLASHGIEVIILKGPVVSEKIFGDIGLYPSGDIDVLLKVEDIDGARKILEATGYKMSDRGFDDYRKYYLRELYHVSMSNGRYTLEPHWNLFMRYFTAPPDFWWDESIIMSSGDRQYKLLSPEKNLLYNSFRLFYKGFTPLRFLAFVASIIENHKEEMDWKKLFDYARAFHFESVLYTTLKLAHDLLKVQIPHQYSQFTNIRLKLLYPDISRMVLTAEDIPPAKKFILAFLRDDLRGVVKIFLRRMFPPMGEIVSRYRVEPRTCKAIGYYLINPMLIILRKHRI